MTDFSELCEIGERWPGPCPACGQHCAWWTNPDALLLPEAESCPTFSGKFAPLRDLGFDAFGSEAINRWEWKPLNWCEWSCVIAELAYPRESQIYVAAVVELQTSWRAHRTRRLNPLVPPTWNARVDLYSDNVQPDDFFDTAFEEYLIRQEGMQLCEAMHYAQTAAAQVVVSLSQTICKVLVDHWEESQSRADSAAERMRELLPFSMRR